MDIFTVAFIGHREIDDLYKVETKLEELIKKLLLSHEYVEFLVGRDGEFDQAVASTVRRTKRMVRDDNSSLVWVMPYPSAEYENNRDSFDHYYDEVEVCEEAAASHFKAAIRIRNRSMIDRADLVVCFIKRKTGGAYLTYRYAVRKMKTIINIADCEMKKS